MKPFMRRIISSLALLVIACAFLAPFSSPALADSPFDQTGAISQDYDRAWVSNPNWMRGIPDSRSLALMSLPGTHDTMTRYGGIRFTTREFVECQTLTLEAQLDAGLRVFDIRLYDKNSSSLRLHHGGTDLGTDYTDVLNTVTRFLKTHPKETVLMRVKQEESSNKAFAQDVQTYLDKPTFNPYLWQPPAGDNLSAPNLGQVRGKIVILQDFSGNWSSGPYSGQPFGLNYGSLPQQDNYDAFLESTKLKSITDFISTTEADLQSGSNKLHLNFISKWPATPSQAAHILNPFTLYYLYTKIPVNVSGGLDSVGVVLMDFPGPALINKVISYNYPLLDNTNNPTTGSGVYLYDDINYGGSPYYVGACSSSTPTYTIRYLAFFNDRTSSIRVLGKCKVTLFREANLAGGNSQFTSSTGFVGNIGVGNDAASSVKVEPLP